MQLIVYLDMLSLIFAVTQLSVNHTLEHILPTPISSN